MKNSASPANEDKVLASMPGIKSSVDNLTLNAHEKIVLLQNLLAHEMNMLERQNLVTAMFCALNKK